MANIKDGGKRTTFKTGAIREIDDSKGRCDLIYNTGWCDVVGDNVYYYLEMFVRYGIRSYVVLACKKFVELAYKNDFDTAYLEVAKHYAEGAKKYSDRNMEKGIPWHSMVDSALRHYTKWRRGDDDEPHARAVIWNLLTLLYTVDYKPELNDLPCKEENVND